MSVPINRVIHSLIKFVIHLKNLRNVLSGLPLLIDQSWQDTWSQWASVAQHLSICEVVLQFWSVCCTVIPPAACQHAPDCMQLVCYYGGLCHGPMYKYGVACAMTLLQIRTYHVTSRPNLASHSLGSYQQLGRSLILIQF